MCLKLRKYVKVCLKLRKYEKVSNKLRKYRKVSKNQKSMRKRPINDSKMSCHITFLPAFSFFYIIKNVELDMCKDGQGWPNMFKFLFKYWTKSLFFLPTIWEKNKFLWSANETNLWRILGEEQKSLFPSSQQKSYLNQFHEL